MGGIGSSRMTLLQRQVLLPLMQSRSINWRRSMSSMSSSNNNIEWKQDSAYINGEWISSSSTKETFDVFDPATENVIATLPDMGSIETKLAIDAADTAFRNSEWKNKLAKERCEILRNIYLKHIEYESELATLLALESGKPYTEAVGEIRYGASFFEWFAEEAKRLEGTIIPEPQQGRKILSMKEAVGVCGFVTPWNFPNAMLARKVAPALAAGCTCVIKPAPETPLSTLALCQIMEEAGLTIPGVVNVVTSDRSTKDVGLALTSDDRVRKISFTGSTEVGKLLLQQSANTVKKVSMELGGDAPFIVFGEDTTSLKEAIDGLMVAKFRNSGQTCVAANRIYVQSNIYDEFADLLTNRVQTSLKVGRYDEPNVNIGPLINRKAVAKVHAFVQDAKNKGAQVMVGGHTLEKENGPCFYAPTVLKLPDCSKNGIEEVFGPVCPLIKFDTEEEVIEMANDTTSGLAAYVYTANLGRIFRLSKALQYGMIGINTGIMSSEVTPFGGIKHSGLGREGSKYGIDEYTHIKTITIQHE